MGEQIENRPAVNLQDLSFSELAELERGIIDERKQRELREAEDAKVNQVAWVYHEQMPGEMVNGAAVWSQPMAPVMGYPSGMMVWYEGTGWQNNLSGVNMSEPGVGAGWVTWEETGSAPPLTPEDFPEDVPEDLPDPGIVDGEVIDHIDTPGDVPDPEFVDEDLPDPDFVDEDLPEPGPEDLYVPEPEPVIPEENPDPEPEPEDLPDPEPEPEDLPDPEIVDGEVIEDIDTPEGN